MLCSTCGTDNSPASRYCGSCGERLGLNCLSCGAGVTSTQRFCTDCGQAVSTSSQTAAGAELLGAPAIYTPPHLARRILEERNAVHGERKHVTVLFCDLVGSTALADSLGPEAMHVLLSDFFKVALDCVHHYEGTVNQFLGDGFMAIFGAPLAYEDHAARGALTALALRDSIAENNSRAPLPGWESVQVRIGLNSGEVVVGAIGDDLRMDYTATGDITNIAARLEAMAAPGEILCGEATAVAARDVIEVEPKAAVPVKGKAAPLVHYRLMSANELTVRRLRTGATFVGREREMSILAQALDQAVTGHGGIVEIEGEPGVGKSRLIAEFSSGAARAATVALGHCITYGRQAPNVPIIDLVRSLLELGTTAADDAILGALDAALGSDNSEHVDAIGALIGIGSVHERIANIDPATVRGRTTQALIRLVQRRALESPVVLIVEDLHWIDASSLDFLSAISAGLNTIRVLLVTTFRPGSDPPWAAEPRRDRILIARLDDDQAEALLESLDEFSALSAARIEQILERGEGNPFFLEELARAGAHDDDDVPGDIFDVLGARIDRLGNDDKDILRTASVVGRHFDLDLLGDIVRQRTGVDPNFQNLVGLGFVEPITPRRYTFVHALTQQVAYEGMLGADSRRLHSTVAQHLVEKANSPEQDCETIARHLLEGVQPAAAIPYLESAIAKTMRGHALEEAHGFFEHALRLLESEPQDADNLTRRIVLLVSTFPIFHFTHRHDEYAGLIERYRTSVDSLGNSPLRGAFLAQRGHRLWTAARFDEAVDVLTEGARISSAAGDHASAAHSEVMLAWSYNNLGDFTAAQIHGIAALEHVRHQPVPMLLCYAHVALLITCVMRGQWTAAAEHGASARNAGVAVADDGLASFGGAFWSWAATASGDPVGGMKIARRALDEAPTDYFRGWAAAFHAWAMCRTGDAAAALPILEQATTLARASHHIGGYLTIAVPLIEARLGSGDVEGARALAVNLRAEAIAANQSIVAAAAETFLGEIDLLEQAEIAALEHFRHATSETRKIGADDAWCHARFGEGRTLAASGDQAGAKRVLDDALRGYERLGTGLFPDRVRAALASIA